MTPHSRSYKFLAVEPPTTGEESGIQTSVFAITLKPYDTQLPNRA